MKHAIRLMLAVAVLGTVTVARGQSPTTYDGPAAFLAELNAWRAHHGRGPVGWDANLAACAAANTGIHAPGSSGGGAQCWAGCRGYLAALRLWQASPPHAQILLGARSAVGCAPCPSGMTANTR